MALIDWYELGSETEADHGNIDLLLSHGEERNGEWGEFACLFDLISVAIQQPLCHDKLRKKDEVFTLGLGAHLAIRLTDRGPQTSIADDRKAA